MTMNFDHIIMNPPYDNLGITEDEVNEIEKEIK